MLILALHVSARTQNFLLSIVVLPYLYKVHLCLNCLNIFTAQQISSSELEMKRPGIWILEHVYHTILHKSYHPSVQDLSLIPDFLIFLLEVYASTFVYRAFVYYS
jgi:hypothetical protein